MRRAIELLGVRVINRKNGEVVGRVQDILFDHQGYLQGFLLERSNWFEKAPFIPLTGAILGEDYITVSEDQILDANSIQQDWIHLTGKSPQFKGMPLISSSGKKLGTLEDVYFQEEVGNIIGYELSDGFFSDVLEGRRMIRSPYRLIVGKDSIIVPEE